MRSCIRDNDAFTGLEAAIVLIAFVVVAAVFSYVVLGAGFFTSQKSQETVYKSVEQATSNLQLLGNVYGVNNSAVSTETDVDTIKFSIGLAPGAPSVDLEKLSLVYSSASTAPTVYTHTTGAADTSHFSSTHSGSAVTTMQAQEQIDLEFKLSEVLQRNSVMTIEIRPPIGAALPFSRTTPPYLYKVNIL